MQKYYGDIKFIYHHNLENMLVYIRSSFFCALFSKWAPLTWLTSTNPAIFLGKNQWVLSKTWLWEGRQHCITWISGEYPRPAQESKRSSMSSRGELQRAGVRQHKVIYQSSKMSPRSDQWLHALYENVSTHAGAFWANCVGWLVWAYFIGSWLQDCHRYTNCGDANHLALPKGHWEVAWPMGEQVWQVSFYSFKKPPKRTKKRKKNQVRTPVCPLDLAQAGCYWYFVIFFLEKHYINTFYLQYVHAHTVCTWSMHEAFFTHDNESLNFPYAHSKFRLTDLDLLDFWIHEHINLRPKKAFQCLKYHFNIAKTVKHTWIYLRASTLLWKGPLIT